MATEQLTHLADPGDIASADQAAEALALSQRTRGNVDIPSGPEGVDPDREKALDAAFAAATKTSVEPAAPAPAKPAAVEPATPPPAPAPTETPSAPPAKKGPLDDLLAEPVTPVKPAAPAAPKPGEDPYDSHKLRSDASERTKETFDHLKRVAREREETERTQRVAAEGRVSALESELNQLKTKLAEPAKIPDEVTRELEELRQFRSKVDLEYDPQFRKQFTERIAGNYESIYAKLSEHGLPATEIERLKGYDEATRVSVIDSLIGKLSPHDRREIEYALIDNTKASKERDAALRDAQSRAGQLVQQRQNEATELARRREASRLEAVKAALPRLPFMHVQPVDAKTPPEERKAIEASNEKALELQAILVEAMKSDDPEALGQMALAVPLAHYYRGEAVRLAAEVQKLNERIEAIEAAGSTSRLSSRSTPAAPAAPAPKPITEQDSGDAIDSLFQQTRGR